MNHRLQALNDRVEAVCIELLSVAESYFGGEVVGSAYGKSIARIPEGPASRNQKRIATQLAILNNIFQVMLDIGDVGQSQCECAAAAIIHGNVTGANKLTVPKTPAELFRRDVLRGLFNAVRVRMPDKTMQSMRLGVLWFKSPDDLPMRNPEIPE